MTDNSQVADNLREVNKSKVEHYLHYIDLINDWTGKIFSFAFIPLTLIAVFEVVSRYMFNRPTLWAWDINIQLLAIITMFGGGYTLLKGEHVIVDIFVSRFSLRKRAIVDSITGLLVLFAVGILVWKATQMGWDSFLRRERLSSVWEPPIYPLKMMVPIGALLLFLQGSAKFIRNCITAVHSRGNK